MADAPIATAESVDETDNAVPAKIETLFAEYDANGDGVVSEQERGGGRKIAASGEVQRRSVEAEQRRGEQRRVERGRSEGHPHLRPTSSRPRSSRAPLGPRRNATKSRENRPSRKISSVKDHPASCMRSSYLIAPGLST